MAAMSQLLSREVGLENILANQEAEHSRGVMRVQFQGSIQLARRMLPLPLLPAPVHDLLRNWAAEVHGMRARVGKCGPASIRQLRSTSAGQHMPEAGMLERHNYTPMVLM